MNKNELNPIQSLSPFKKLCMTIGQLPTSYAASMSYYEANEYLEDYLEKVVIPTVNNNADSVSELQNLFIQLHDYTEHYFDNLDVQEEINNKLDNMAESGEILEIMKPYINPIINQQNTRIDQIFNVVQSVVPGSPKGSYARIEDLRNANPETGVYIVTSNGHIYSWTKNQSENPIDLGVYQATGIASKEVLYDNLSDEIRQIFSTDFTGSVEQAGKYIYHTGARLSSSVSYTAITNIDLKKNETMYVNCHAVDACCVIGIDNGDGTFIPKAVGLDESTQLIYKYTSTEDCKIAISYRSNRPFYYFKFMSPYDLNDNIKSIYTDLFDVHTPTFTITEGKYINHNGGIYSSVNHCYTSPILLKAGETITMKGITGDIVSAIAKLNDDDTYTNLVNGTTDTGIVNTYIYTADADTNIVLSFRFNRAYSAEIRYNFEGLAQYIFNNISSIKQRLSNVEEQLKPNINKLLMFNKIIGIGDSLTYGQVYIGNTAGHTSRQSYNPYPKALAKLCGSDYQIVATSGATAQSLWNTKSSEISNLTNDTLCIIYLGTNYGLTDTLETDAPEGQPYTSWADTNTGCYAKFIAKCLNLGAKVLLSKIYTTGGEGGASLQTTNQVIEKMALRFNVPFIENTKLTDSIYHLWPDGQGSNSVHYNDLGYSVFAQKVIDEVKKLSDTELQKLLPQ